MPSPTRTRTPNLLVFDDDKQVATLKNSSADVEKGRLGSTIHFYETIGSTDAIRFLPNKLYKTSLADNPRKVDSNATPSMVFKSFINERANSNTEFLLSLRQTPTATKNPATLRTDHEASSMTRSVASSLGETLFNGRHESRVLKVCNRQDVRGSLTAKNNNEPRKLQQERSHIKQTFDKENFSSSISKLTSPLVDHWKSQDKEVASPRLPEIDAASAAEKPKTKNKARPSDPLLIWQTPKMLFTKLDFTRQRFSEGGGDY